MFDTKIESMVTGKTSDLEKHSPYMRYEHTN